MTLSKEELSGLVERVRRLRGPDREVDALIGKALGVPFKARNVYSRGHYNKDGPVLLRVAEDYPQFTASVDAALALVERVQPGIWSGILWQAISMLNKQLDWHISHPKTEQMKLLPITVILAFLLSLQSQEPTL